MLPYSSVVIKTPRNMRILPAMIILLIIGLESLMLLKQRRCLNSLTQYSKTWKKSNSNCLVCLLKSQWDGTLMNMSTYSVFFSFQVLQSSPGGQESWLLYFNCILASLWLYESLPQGVMVWSDIETF